MNVLLWEWWVILFSFLQRPAAPSNGNCCISERQPILCDLCPAAPAVSKALAVGPSPTKS